MSTIRADNIGPSAGGTTTDLLSGLSKAWVTFYGNVTLSADDSLNISSLTDQGTGNYRINYTNSFSTGFYVLNCSLNGVTARPVPVVYRLASTVTSYAVGYSEDPYNNGLVKIDCGEIGISMHGDLA